MYCILLMMTVNVTSVEEYCLLTSCNFVLAWDRPGDSPAPIKLKANERITLTCDTSEKASETVLPVSCGSFKGYDLQPGSTVFVGQYLFTGSETSSARMVIEKVCDLISVVQIDCMHCLLINL